VPRRSFSQLVPEGRTVTNRLHLDVLAADHGHLVMVDPEGNEFCLLRPA